MNTEVKHHTIGPEDHQRLDNYLIRRLKGVPKSHIYRLIRSGQVRVNGSRPKAMTRLIPGDVVRVPPVRCAKPNTAVYQEHVNQKIKVLYEDTDFMVVNKPANLPVHAGNCSEAGVIEVLRAQTQLPYLELVHRLDKATSGCLCLAKKRSALRRLQAIWHDQSVQKIYRALVAGQWPKVIKVTAPLLRREGQPVGPQVVVHPDGKASESHFITQHRYPDFTDVKIQIKTGRMHQIRVHAAFMGCPVVGDQRYGKRSDFQEIESSLLKRMQLHAWQFSFPTKDGICRIQAPLPDTWPEASRGR